MGHGFIYKALQKGFSSPTNLVLAYSEASPRNGMSWSSIVRSLCVQVVERSWLVLFRYFRTSFVRYLPSWYGPGGASTHLYVSARLCVSSALPINFGKHGSEEVCARTALTSYVVRCGMDSNYDMLATPLAQAIFSYLQSSPQPGRFKSAA
jgi:hypothetical protein